MKPKPEGENQSEKFKQAARELGADIPEDAFNRALRKIASAPPAPMQATDKRRNADRKPRR